MGSFAISVAVFTCIFAGALAGIALRRNLPLHHLTGDSKDSLRLGMGLVGTMAALLLSLLVASAKSSYDAQSAQVTQLAASVALLDRFLALYGPESKEARDTVREEAIRVVDQMWSKDGTRSSRLASSSAVAAPLYAQLQSLSPKTDRQRTLQSQALSTATDIAKIRLLMYEQATVGISTPLLVALVVWLTISFASFGITSPYNATVVGGFFLAALSVSSAIFLILEMYNPYAGMIQISDAPLRAALAQLGQ
ncbi:MAG TPA: hypothetical protein VFW70_16020 [Methylomirabilota bacterium]|nr:hypothetical protein [Methylomirabilota bacterium]